MGAFVSKEGCQSHYNITLNCPQNATCYNGTSQCSQIGDVERGKFPADPDIAGIGVSTHLPAPVPLSADVK